MNLSGTGAGAGGEPAINPTIRAKRTSRPRRVLARSVPYGEKLVLSKAQEQTLGYAVVRAALARGAR
jgi:hypothetical protein